MNDFSEKMSKKCPKFCQKNRQKSLIFQLCVCRVSRVFELALLNFVGACETVLAMWGTFRRTDPIILSWLMVKNDECPKCVKKIWLENKKKMFCIFNGVDLVMEGFFNISRTICNLPSSIDWAITRVNRTTLSLLSHKNVLYFWTFLAIFSSWTTVSPL